MLHIKDLVVSYGHIEALRGVSLTIPQGKIISIIGSNGAGKSTLLNTISGLVTPKGGEMLFEGKPLPDKAHKIVFAGLSSIALLAVAECGQGNDENTSGSY